MKKLVLMLMLCAPMTMFAQKFGHLDSQALISSLPEAIKVQGELEADKKKSGMSATDQAKEEQALQDMYQKIQQTAQDNQQQFNKLQQEKLGPILAKVRTAIEHVAKNGGYTYIMEKAAGQPLYINEALSKDVTAEVKVELNKIK